MITAEQVKKIIDDTGGKFSFHKCNICNYICGYVIRNNQLYYDSGCDCVTYPYVFTPNSDAQLMEFFEMNPQYANEKFVKENIFYD